MNTLKKIFSRETRKWLYAIAIAAFPVLAYYGVIEVEALPLVIPLVLAILNLPDKNEETYYVNE